MRKIVPFSRPDITPAEISATVDVLLSGWLTIGKTVEEFELALSKYLGTPNVVALDSCTSALTLAGDAIRFFHERNKRAVIPALTFVATANALWHAGWEISFADVGWDGNLAANAIEGSYDLAVPVHYAGQVCDLKELSTKAYLILEDAAHAIGANYDGTSVGLSQYSEGACFSFYPTKNMTTVEGGAFIGREAYYSDYIKTLSLHGLGSGHIDRYQRSSLNRPTLTNTPGYKANMTNVEAAIGLVQLQKLDHYIERREFVAHTYQAELGHKVRFLAENGRDHVWHMCVILVENRDEVVADLRAKGIYTGIHYSPIIPQHPFYANLTDYKAGQFPVAEYIADHCISLPLFGTISDDEVEMVVTAVKEL